VLKRWVLGLRPNRDDVEASEHEGGGEMEVYGYCQLNTNGRLRIIAIQQRISIRFHCVCWELDVHTNQKQTSCFSSDSLLSKRDV
jgi:hypothetical protein